MKLSKRFIDKVQNGVSMNLLTFRKPDIVYVCDTSEYGLGDLHPMVETLTYQMTPELRNRAHIHILQYLAQIISVWIDII